MTTTETSGRHGEYVLGHSDEEYERLRAQAQIWEVATSRMLDRVNLTAGARCLDAGCGPGVTMRLLAQRVGPTGQVHGVDSDAQLGRRALATLHEAGHRQCAFTPVDLDKDRPVPGAPYDLVYARLLLFHVSDRPGVLRRLWDAVAPGGHLVVQDYDLGTVDVHPPLASLEEWKRVVYGTFTAAGRDIRIGHHLPELYAEAGVGAPEGTEVAGRLEPLRDGGAMVAAVHRSLGPAAVALGVASEQEQERWQADFAADVAGCPDSSLLWPLLVGAWKRKEAA